MPKWRWRPGTAPDAPKPRMPTMPPCPDPLGGQYPGPAQFALFGELEANRNWEERYPMSPGTVGSFAED